MTRARHRLRLITRNRLLLLALAAAGVLFIVGSVLWAQAGQQAAQQQTGVVERQRDAAAGQAQSLAEQIKTACTAGDLHGAVCDQAEQVAATPVPGPTGPRGATGDQGATGVPGPAGSQGAQGPQGVPGGQGSPGPTGAAGADGSNGDPGPQGDRGAQGEPGRQGEQGPRGDEGPPGPQGEPGAPPDSYTMQFSDGTTQTCSRSGGSDTAPTYACAAPVSSGDEGSGPSGP